MNALVVDKSQLVIGAVIADLPVRMNLGIDTCRECPPPVCYLWFIGLGLVVD